MGRLALALLWLVAALPAAAAVPGEIHLGFVGTLSGARAHLGQDALDGFLLGLKHAGGGLAGHETDLLTADDRMEPATAREAAQRLVQPRKIALLLIAATSPETMAAAAAPALAADMTVLSLNEAGPEAAGSRCHPALFSLAGRRDIAEELTGAYLRSRGFASVAVVSLATSEGSAAVEAFRRGYAAEPALVATVAAGAMRHGEVLQAIRRRKPDAVFAALSGGVAVTFLRQWAAAGLQELPLFAPPTMLDRVTAAAAGDAAVGAFSLAPWSEELANPANRRFTADFESEFGRPPSLYAVRGYDAALLLDAALRATGGRLDDRDGLRAALRRAEFASVRGSFRFAGNQFPVENYILRQIARRDRRVVQEVLGVSLDHQRDPLGAQCPLKSAEEIKPAAAEKRGGKKR